MLNYDPQYTPQENVFRLITALNAAGLVNGVVRDPGRPFEEQTAKALLNISQQAEDGGGGGGGGLAGGVQFLSAPNAAGNNTFTLDEHVGTFTALTALTGSAGTRIFILAVTNASEGSVIRHRVACPTTADIVLEWRNATSGGTLLTSYTTDLSGDGVYVDFVFNGTAWDFVNIVIPSNP